jgi:hypothetical protein
MKKPVPSRLINKLGNACTSLGVAIALSTGLVWANSAEAIGFNDGNGNGGVTFNQNPWGDAITNNPANPNPNSGSYGSVDVPQGTGTSATIFGPDDGINLYGGSYMDYYYTAVADSMLSFSSPTPSTFQSNDSFNTTDDQAGYFVINGPYAQIASPTYLNGGPIVPTNNAPIPSTYGVHTSQIKLG